MANYRGPRAKISRRFGTPILGCEKVLKKKNYPPGQHGRKRKRPSAYALQLAEKQKLKYAYGLGEKQLKRLVKKATKQKGVSGDTLMQLVEMRLDNVVVRLGISPSNAAARQLVVHRHIRVNGNVVNKPSCILKEGDTITLSPKAKTLTIIQQSLASHKASFSWLSWNKEELSGVVVAIPERKLIPKEIHEKTIIELYAK